MRVPDSSLFDLSRSRLEDARGAVADAQSQLLSGHRVQKASDDPLAAAFARRHEARIALADSTSRSADAVQTRLSVADDALGQSGDLLAQASQLAVELGNDTASASDRAAAATQIDAIHDQLVALANTQVEGRYIFAGRADASPPYSAAGVFSGDTTAPSVELAPSVAVQSGVTGGTTFGSTSGTDVFSVLSALSAALSSNNGNAIRGAIGGLSTATDQVLASRAVLGTNMDALDVVKTAAANAKDESQKAQSALIDIDPYAAASRLAQAQNALQTAVDVASKLPLPGLASR